MNFYLAVKHNCIFGVEGSLAEALRANPSGSPQQGDYRKVGKEEYENTVIDLRYENGAWRQ